MKNSSIEWTHHTFNPWVGCTKVSPGCDNCYAERWAKRAGSPGLWQGERRRTSKAYWNAPYAWDCVASTGIRRRVFCASLADVFDNAVPDEWRRDLWQLIAQTPHLDWLLLTKRIGNAAAMLPKIWGPALPNVWLGATVVNQDEADRDLPKLLAVPAAVHFLSVEPMLGPVDLARACDLTGDHANRKHLPDWIIVGGESGGAARPMSPAWVDGLFGSCRDYGVPFFFKQWGEWSPVPMYPTHKSHRWPITSGEPPGGLWSYRVGKHRAGRRYLERTHDNFPEVR